MAEPSYLRTAKYLGGADDLAQKWVSAVMYRLREEVEEQLLANRKLSKAWHEELVGKPIEPQPRVCIRNFRCCFG